MAEYKRLIKIDFNKPPTNMLAFIREESKAFCRDLLKVKEELSFNALLAGYTMHDVVFVQNVPCNEEILKDMRHNVITLKVEIYLKEKQVKES